MAERSQLSDGPEPEGRDRERHVGVDLGVAAGRRHEHGHGGGRGRRNTAGCPEGRRRVQPQADANQRGQPERGHVGRPGRPVADRSQRAERSGSISATATHDIALSLLPTAGDVLVSADDHTFGLQDGSGQILDNLADETANLIANVATLRAATGSGAPSDTMITVTADGGTVVPGTDVDAYLEGVQVRTDQRGGFGFWLQRPTGSGGASGVYTVNFSGSERDGRSTGTATYRYAGVAPVLHYAPWLIADRSAVTVAEGSTAVNVPDYGQLASGLHRGGRRRGLSAAGAGVRYDHETVEVRLPGL